MAKSCPKKNFSTRFYLLFFLRFYPLFVYLCLEDRITIRPEFLSLCLQYMDRMRQFSLSACSKLAAGKTDEVTRMLQGDSLMNEQTEAFFSVFDDAFLNIYPTFVRDVNALLQPDKRIELREGERLNTDLRILAFMRMGLEDSGCIAQIQGYSVNTIYAYRNKLRNRAINRDSFEEDIIKIGP